MAPALTAFSIASRVLINNKASKGATVIEVKTKDRPGLLFDLALALYQLRLNVVSAHICTYGEKAVDVFYVQNKDGSKAEHKTRQRNIHEKLLQAAKGKITGMPLISHEEGDKLGLKDALEMVKINQNL